MIKRVLNYQIILDTDKSWSHPTNWLICIPAVLCCLIYHLVVIIVITDSFTTLALYFVKQKYLTPYLSCQIIDIILYVLGWGEGLNSIILRFHSKLKLKQYIILAKLEKNVIHTILYFLIGLICLKSFPSFKYPGIGVS